MGQFSYKGKRQKIFALKAIRSKAVKLFNGDDISLNDFKKIDDIVRRNIKRM